MLDYMTAYKRFISSAKKKMHGIDSKRKIYKVGSDENLEVHYVKPKRLGGNSKFKNLVLLSHADHVYAHLLLNLALAQKNCYDDIFRLDYVNVPNSILKMIKDRKNIFRGLKIDVFISGKKQSPITMSIVDAAKILCVLARYNYENKMLLAKMTTEVIRLALFHKSKFGYKMKFHM